MTHTYDTLEFQSGGTLTGTLTVGLADIDTVNGPPGRDDGTIDQFADIVNPTGTTNHSVALSAGRSLAHGALIAVVFKVTAYTSGSVTISRLAGQTTNQHLPIITTFLDAAYSNLTGSIPAVSLLASGDGHYATLRGGVPLFTASPTTVTVDADTTIKRAALGFTVVAPVYGMEGEVLVTNVAGGDITVAVYNGTNLMKSVVVDANMWGADAQTRWLEFCFDDVAFLPGSTYYLAVVGASTECQVYTAEATTPERWDPLTGAAGGGTVGYSTFDSSWSALDESVLPFFRWWPTGINGLVVGSRLNILPGS